MLVRGVQLSQLASWYAATNEDGQILFLLYEIMPQLFVGATSKSSQECIYVLFFTWLQSPFFFQDTSPDGMQRNLSSHDRALTQPLFTWSHVMWSSATRQNHSLCFTVPSRTAFNRRPHYATNNQEKEARSGLCHHSVPAISCHNGGMWPLLAGNALLMDSADLKGGFCLLSLSHDGPGFLATADLDLRGLIQSECAQSASLCTVMELGTNQKWDVWELFVFLFRNNRQQSRCASGLPNLSFWSLASNVKSSVIVQLFSSIWICADVLEKTGGCHNCFGEP